MVRGHCEEFRRVGTTRKSITLSTLAKYLIDCHANPDTSGFARNDVYFLNAKLLNRQRRTKRFNSTS